MVKLKPVLVEASKPVFSEDPESFEKVFLDHWDPICRTLIKITGDVAQAEDLTLETFWRYWQHPPAEMENRKAWLFRVAVNLGFNAIRSARRRDNYEIEAGMERLEAQVPANPEVVCENGQQRELVHLILSKMNPREAKILILRHSGQSYRQIAETLRIPTTSVGATLVRAEKHFRKLCEKTGLKDEPSE